jgi:hypothetical protein
VEEGDRGGWGDPKAGNAASEPVVLHVVLLLGRSGLSRAPAVIALMQRASFVATSFTSSLLVDRTGDTPRMLSVGLVEQGP